LVGQGLLQRVGALAAPAAFLRTKVVESRRPGDAQQPGVDGAAPRIEAPPVAERLLERLGGEVLRYRPVPRQVDEIAVNVVEMALDRGREGRDGVAGRGGRGDARAGCTPPGQRDVTRRGRRLRRPGRARTARAGRTAGRPAMPGARAA